MDERIVQYIKEHLQAGENVTLIFDHLRSNGVSDDEINSSFQAALAEKQAPALAQEQSKEPAKEKSSLDLHNLNPTKAFTVIGIVLILVALAVVIFSTWGVVSPFVRIMYLALPMLALFGISRFTREKGNLNDVSILLFFSGALIVPFFIGTFLYQTGLTEELSPNLFILTSLLSIAFYLFAKFVLKRHFLATLIIMALYILVGAIAARFEMEMTAITWLFFVLSALILAFGLYAVSTNIEENKTFLFVGILVSIISLPTAIILSLNENLTLSEDAISFIIAFFGLGYVFLAIPFYRYYFKVQNLAVYRTKRLLEELGSIVVMISFLWLAWDNIGYSLLLIFLGAGYIFTSVRIKIRALIILGIVGLFYGLIFLSFKIFPDSGSWPFIIIVIGFLAIGVGIWINRLLKNRPDYGPFYGLGQDKILEDHPENKKR